MTGKAGFIGILSIVTALNGVVALKTYAAPESGFRMIETSQEFASYLVEKYGDKVKSLSNVSTRKFQTLADGSPDSAILLVPEDKLPALSKDNHERTHRCGGFFDITDESVRPLALKGFPAIERYAYPLLSGTRPEVVAALNEVRAADLESFVATLTKSFTTRQAGTSEGDKAPAWLAKYWQDMANVLNPTLGVTVELVHPPRGYSQSNVRITIPGSDATLPHVILGAHLDSINLARPSAPGADDNASGIAALTEAYRALLASPLKPKATIQIFGYAAEELGLLGSLALAGAYRKQGVKVRGVLQLDMVSYPGKAKKMTFITDNVNRELTTWTEQLYGLYVGGEIQESRCGYGCSDHASWDRYGYPTVFPFEASFDEHNKNIHSENDLWTSELNADYAARFAKLALVFATELSEATQ